MTDEQRRTFGERNADHEPSSYFEEIAAINVEVQRVLQETLPERARAPTDLHCYNLAVFIHTMKVMKKKYRNDVEHRKKRSNITPLETAAKKFLKELSAERAFLLNSVPIESAEYIKADLDRMDVAQQSVTALIVSFNTRPYNVPLEMGRRLIEAWRQMGGEITQGVKEGDSFLETVTALMALGGKKLSSGTVADYLRGRADRARSGRSHHSDPEGAQKG